MLSGKTYYSREEEEEGTENNEFISSWRGYFATWKFDKNQTGFMEKKIGQCWDSLAQHLFLTIMKQPSDDVWLLKGRSSLHSHTHDDKKTSFCYCFRRVIIYAVRS